MGYYDAANVLANVGSSRQKKKEARWGQIMDIAGLGMDVWNKLSKVPEAKEMASYESELREGEATAGLEQDKRWLDYQQAHPNKPADQLFQEWLMTPEGMAAQDEQSRRERLETTFKTNEQIRAERARGKQGLNADALSVYDKAIARAQEKYLELDESGNVRWKQGVTPQMVLAELKPWADPQFVGTDNVNAIMRLFEQFVNDPWLDEESSVTAQGDVDIRAILDQISGLVKQAPAAEPTRPSRQERLEAELGPLAGNIVAGGTSAMGSEYLDRSNRERSLEEGLRGILSTPNIQKEDRKAAEYVLKRSSETGFLSDQDYSTFLAVLRSLQKIYGGVRATK